jgi:hypothetical protein
LEKKEQMKKIDPKDPKTIVPALQEWFGEMQTAYMGMLDKVPEGVRPQIEALKRKVDLALTSLASQPTDQVPAAQEAAWSLQCLAQGLARVDEMINGSMETIRTLLAQMTPVNQELRGYKDGLSKDGLSGAYFTKEQHEKAVSDAKVGADTQRKLMFKRAAVLLGLGLPLPLEEKSMEGEEAAFTAIQTEATRRRDELKKAGALSTLEGDDLSTVLFGSKAEFERTLKLAKKFSGGKEEDDLPPDPLLEDKSGGGKKDGKLRFVA